MTTSIGDVIDRLYRTFLEPPDSQPVTAVLGASITTETAIPVGAFALPEDKELMRTGIVLEIDSELMRVTDYNFDTNVATVVRPIYGTTRADHAADATIRFGNPYSRLSVFEAVADRIIALHPELYTVKSRAVSAVADGNIAPLNDDLAIAIVRIRPNEGYGPELQGELVDYHPQAGGRAVIIRGHVGNAWVTYRRRMGKATDETDTLESLGVDERWVKAIITGAAADILVGKDIPEVQANWVGQILKTEAIPFGDRQQIAFGLAQYADMLVTKYAKEMTAEYRPKVRMRSPFDIPVRGVTG
jgi:hypothetical protein